MKIQRNCVNFVVKRFFALVKMKFQLSTVASLVEFNNGIESVSNVQNAVDHFSTVSTRSKTVATIVNNVTLPLTLPFQTMIKPTAAIC